MAGHSKWAQIKHQKGVTDKKRGQLFSKLLNAIAAAAKNEPNPKFNPRLRTAVDKARENNVPQDNIDRAIRRAHESTKGFEEIVLGAYGPGGVAILVEIITDNKNRTVAEVKNILNENGGKWAEAESVAWVFEKKQGREDWQPKFVQQINADAGGELEKLVSLLKNQNDVQRIYTNASVE